MIIFLLFSGSFMALSAPKDFVFEFKDGTVIRGTIYSDLFYSINKAGLTILTEDAKIYFHHYPFEENNYKYTNKTPTIYAPPISSEVAVPFGTPHCTPSRISFFHFKRKTLKSLYDSYSKSNTPQGLEIKKAIVVAYNKPVPMPREKGSVEKTKVWQGRVERELGSLFKYGHQPNFHRAKGVKGWVWGKDIFPKKHFKK